ncbi:hypothetical protein R3P38DRAFT_2773200 [Favolaschia claudopus]|uniref:Transmembrane protein n=1 Tax=Favolaschia claudopus TaxID=2862362 RepID=A0AAW0C0C9_9AGAR
MDHLVAVARKSEAGASYLFSIILVLLVLFGLVFWLVDEDILVGFWFGLEEVVSRLTSFDLSWLIRWWEGIPLDETTTRSLASAQHYHPSFPFSRHIYIILSLPTMVLIATCIYFAWSPVLARASPLFGLCCLIGGWISRFTHTLIPRVSYGAHREGLIKTIYGGRPALAPYIIPLSDDSAGSFDDEQPIFIGLNEIHDNEDENTRAATRRERRTAPFSIPRPWDREAPRLVKENIDEIVEFLEMWTTLSNSAGLLTGRRERRC